MTESKKEKQAGFSLLEVVISTGILVIVAGAFLTMTAANGTILLRERSLAQNAYELSAMAENGEGEPLGEELELVFEGDGGSVSEIFGKYKVENEKGDTMTYYKRESQ